MRSLPNGLRVLVFDGELSPNAGVWPSFYVFEEMINRLAFDEGVTVEEIYPCKHFDLIIGTRHGGVLAILFGRFGLNLPQVKRIYTNMFFPEDPLNPGSLVPNLHESMGENVERLEAFLQDLVKKEMGCDDAETETLMKTASTRPSCATAILTSTPVNLTFPTPFRTYRVRENATPDCPVWQAVRAATAAPDHFLPMKIDEQMFTTANDDLQNNPTLFAIQECPRLYPSSTLSCLIHIGSDPNYSPDGPFSDLSLDKLHSNWTLDPEAWAQDFLQSLNQHAQNKFYFKFNIEKGLQLNDIPATDVLDTITTHVTDYLHNPDNNWVVNNAVAALRKRQTAMVPLEKVIEDIFQISRFPMQDSAPDSELMRLYSRRLYAFDHGLPLWDPQPLDKAVEIGDVGFFDRHGGFRPLFNITAPKDKQPYPVPERFEPFHIAKEQVRMQRNAINKPYLNSGIRIEKDETMPWKFNCDVVRGALLVIKDAPVKVFIEPTPELVKYIEINQEAWYESLETRLDCPAVVIDESKLLLVTGVYRCYDWTLGSWSKLPGPLSMSYNRENVGTSKVGWVPSPTTGIRDGPSTQPVSHQPLYDLSNHRIGDQTLFVEGFRVANRHRHQALQDLLRNSQGPAWATAGWFGSVWNWLAGTRSLASGHVDLGYPLAPPPSGAGSFQTSGNEASVMSPRLEPIGNHSYPNHPLDSLITAVFQTFPSATSAIVHDQDLIRLKQAFEKHGTKRDHILQNFKQSGNTLYFSQYEPISI